MSLGFAPLAAFSLLSKRLTLHFFFLLPLFKNSPVSHRGAWSQAITQEQILPGSDLGITQCHRYPICRHKHVCVPKKCILR